MRFLYFVRNMTDLFFQFLLIKPIEFFLTIKTKDLLEKIFKKLLYCQKKKRFMKIYYRIYQRSLNDLSCLIKEFVDESNWHHYQENDERELEIFSKESIHCDIFNLRILMDSEKTITYCGCQQIFSVAFVIQTRNF